MMQTIRITVTGKYNQTDGYVELLLGSLGLSGAMKSYNLSREWENGKTDTIHIDAEMHELPLGHLGAQDIPVVPSLTPRQMAVRQALDFRDMVRDEPYYVLDTETTGLERGEIVQIAVLDQDGRALVYHYVKPTGKIPLEATAIHGITDAMVKDAPTWKQTSDELQALLTGKNIVIYNAVYDRKMMHQSAEAAGLPHVDWKNLCKFWCAMESFAVIYGQWNEYKGSYRWQKLSTAADYFEIEPSTAHDALGDCMTTLGVCKHISVMPTIE